MLFLGLIGLASLFGCGKQQETINDDTKTVFETAENSEHKIPEHFKLDITNGGSHSISIDADIDSTDYDKAKTYKIDKLEITDDYLRNLASKLFDGGEYKSVLSYSYWDMDDLTKEKENFDAMMAEAGEDYLIPGPLYNDLMYALGREENVVSIKPTLVNQDGVIYKEQVDIDGNDVEYLYANLVGKINGKEYQLKYSTLVELNDTSNINIVPRFPVTLSGFAYNIESELGAYTELAGLGEKASKLVDQMGYSDFFLAKSESRVIVPENEGKKFYDGGYFRFVRKMPELNNSGCESVFVEIDDLDEKTFKLLQQEYIEIELNENGDIADINVCTPYDMKETMAENIELLSFDAAMDSANNYFKQISDQDGIWQLWRSTKVDSIKLSYIPLEYDGQYVYMPVWILFEIEQTMGEEKFPMIAVNAIDGNVYFFSHANSIHLPPEG